MRTDHSPHYPNTLELLFVPSVLASDAMGEWILAERAAFLSSRIHASFGQYALSQLKKLKRSPGAAGAVRPCDDGRSRASFVTW